MAKKGKSAKQTKTAARAAKKSAQKTINRIEKKSPKDRNKQEKAKLKAAQRTKSTATKAISAATSAEGMSLEELREARTAAMKTRAGEKGLSKFDAALQARAYANAMRDITGRQKGQGTAYTGPGMRVAIDAEGNIQRDDQGRVMYDVDPEAYEKRFIPKFTPTEEQQTMWKELFPESKYGITEGLLTPWQQVNMQWMTGSKSDKLGLLDDMGIKATDKNVGLFTDDLKEGRIPASWREAWRTEQWGDVKDPDTGLWKPATGEQRQQAIAKQQERYEKGYFNPTTGKGGAARGAPSQWGPGTGLISPEDFVPPGWKGPLPAPGMGVTGVPTGIFAPGGGGVGSVINQGAYRRPAPLDWSAIMPKDTPLESQRALVAGKGKFYQPWATRQATPRALINYQMPGGAGVDVGYSNPNLGLFDFNGDTTTTNGDTTTTQQQLQTWQQPGWDYSQYKDPTITNPKPIYKATGWTSNAEWYKSLLTPAQQAAGFKNLQAGKAAGHLGILPVDEEAATTTAQTYGEEPAR